MINKLKIKLEKIEEVENSEYLYAIKDIPHIIPPNKHFIKYKKYKIENVKVEKSRCAITFDIKSEFGSIHNFDYRWLDKDNRLYMFDTIVEIRKSKLKSIL